MSKVAGTVRTSSPHPRGRHFSKKLSSSSFRCTFGPGKPGTLEELFEQLVEQFRSDQSERAIEQLAAGDRQLETQLRQLLSAYESAQRDEFLQTPGKELLKPSETPSSEVSQHSDTTT